MKESYFNKFRNFQYNQRSYVVQKRTIVFPNDSNHVFPRLWNVTFFLNTLCSRSYTKHGNITRKDRKNKRGRMLVYTMHGSSIEIQSGQKYDHRDRRITHSTNNRLYFERNKFAFSIIKGRFELRNERIRYRQTPVPSGWSC